MDAIRTARFVHAASGAELEAVRVVVGDVRLPLHVHATHSITAFVDHAHAFVTMSQTHPVPVGALAIAPAGMPHANVPSRSHGLCFHALELTPWAWQRLLGDNRALRADMPVIRHPRAGRAVAQVVELAIAGERSEQRDGLLDDVAELLAVPDVDELAVPAELAIREVSGDLDAANGARTTSACRDVLFAMLRERCHMGDLAAALGLSADHFARCFKNECGMTAHQFLLSARVDAARKLLREGTGIAEVAVTVGFADQAHLTRVFRKHYGITPGGYRRVLGLRRN